MTRRLGSSEIGSSNVYYDRLGLIAGDGREGIAATCDAGTQSLGERLLLEQLVRAQLHFAPWVLDVLALAEARTDRQPQEEAVAYLGRHQVDIARTIYPLQQLLVQLIRALTKVMRLNSGVDISAKKVTESIRFPIRYETFYINNRWYEYQEIPQLYNT